MRKPERVTGWKTTATSADWSNLGQGHGIFMGQGTGCMDSFVGQISVSGGAGSSMSSSSHFRKHHRKLESTEWEKQTRDGQVQVMLHIIQGLPFPQSFVGCQPSPMAMEPVPVGPHAPGTFTSGGRDILLQDADVELDGELRRGAQEGLDDRHTLEGIAVRGQPPLRVAHLLLHLHLVALSQPPLAGDGDVGLLLPP